MAVADLSSRAGDADVLPGSSRWVEVVAGEAGCAAPRIVLIASSQALKIRVAWSAGAGDQAVELTMGRGVKVCVWARSVRVWAQHIGSNDTVKVSATITDGWEPTRNSLTADIELGPNVFQIPEWACAVRLELANEAEMPNSTIDLLDPSGVLRSRTLGSAQPDRGLALAGIGSVEVTATAVGRILFDLAF